MGNCECYSSSFRTVDNEVICGNCGDHLTLSKVVKTITDTLSSYVNMHNTEDVRLSIKLKLQPYLKHISENGILWDDSYFKMINLSKIKITQTLQYISIYNFKINEL